MAHLVQLSLGAFMSSIKVISPEGHMRSGFKAGYIAKVMRFDNGFPKTVEKVMCLTSDALVPILQMHTHTFIRTNAYAQIHMHKFICSTVYAQIHCLKLNAHQCESRTKSVPHCSHLRYLLSEIMLIMVYSIVKWVL